MAMPTFTMRQLLEAGVHFGHRAGRWNPKMAPYIFGERNGVHIIDLEQTVPMLYHALEAIRDIVAHGGRVLFVGTKRQAAAKVSEAAQRCGQYYVNHRWLGGMMTNWSTVTHSVNRLKSVESQLAEDEATGLTKKELLQLTRERDKLERALGGIKEMGALPDILFVIDTNREDIAVAEANKLGIPVAAVVDSNSDPEAINYPVPGNDDAIRAINLYCDLVADAVLDGIQQEMAASGLDVGESEKAPAEDLGAAEQAAPAEAAFAADEPAETSGAESEAGKSGAATAPLREKAETAAEAGQGERPEQAPDAAPEEAAESDRAAPESAAEGEASAEEEKSKY